MTPPADSGHAVEEVRARRLICKANRYFGTVFEEVVHAGTAAGLLEAVVRDRSGWLWLCREARVPLGIAKATEPVHVLVPVWGPVPDPIDRLPDGHPPGTVAVLSAARTRLLARLACRARCAA